MEQKKIVHFVHFSANPGGIEVQLPTIIKNINPFTFNSFVIRPVTNVLNSVYNGTNIRVSYGSTSNLFSYLKLFVYCLHNKHDIFHLFNAGPVYLLLICACGVERIVYSIHGTIYWRSYWGKKILKFFWKLALGKKIILTSNSKYSEFVFNRDISKRNPVTVIYNPIAIKNSSTGRIKNNTIKVVYVGRLVKGKGLEQWVKTAIQIHEKIPDTSFEVFGDGPLKAMLDLIIARGNASDYIKLRGFSPDVYNIYRESDLLLFLSEYESFGNVVVESILCGTPVIASAIPSMQEIFENYPEFLVPLDKSIEANVLEKIKNIDALKKLTLKAAEEFRVRFSLKKHMTQLEQVYASFDF